MTDSRKRRGAKRARQRDHANSDDDNLIVTIRKTLAKHPLHLLNVASYFVSRSMSEDESPMERIVVTLACIRRRETTALLAVLAELIDDHPLRERCREEVATRNHYLPTWIVDLPNAEVRSVVRRTDVLGDGDELAIGLRLAGGTELTLGAFFDHNYLSVVTDLTLVPHPLDQAGTQGRKGVDSQTAFVDMDPADARAWLEHGIGRGDWLPRRDGWREALPLVRWLLAQLPGGGAAYEKPVWDDDAMTELLDGFFDSPAGAPFGDAGYQELLVELCDSGCGDPSRWSVSRVSSILRNPFHDEHVPLEIEVDAPAMLRAFIPFAHAHSGIRQDLTADAIASIDKLSLRYKRALLEDASEHYDGDDLELPPWRDRAS